VLADATRLRDPSSADAMTDDARGYLLRQFETAWALTAYHLEGLTTAECLWRPAAAGLHVTRDADGTWRADWPEHEGYDLGPPSIGWITWHIVFWWSTLFDHMEGEGTLVREEVPWPGDAEAVRATIGGLHDRWAAVLEGVTDDDLRAAGRVRWPLGERPLGDVVAWVNVELIKNAPSRVRDARPQGRAGPDRVDC
jgi:hypothetical protein